jgi:stage IV sporulation protein A
MEELHLAEPTLVKKGSNYGVRFRAAGASYHIMKVEIDGQVEPIVGGKSQGESFCSSLLEAYEQQPEKVWETNVFGSSVRQLLEVELGSKNKGVSEELKGKFRRTLSKIVNEGKGGFLCILL